MASAINLTLYRFVNSLVHKAFADVAESEMRLQPLPAMNPPVWILGHVVCVQDYIPKFLGHELACPKEWHTWFAPGSKLEALPSQLPTKVELMRKLSEVSERILTLVPQTAATDWAKPNPTSFFSTELPTLLDISENILNCHTMLHVGQMTVWRRSQNKPGVIVVPGV
jgi:hypothetical protein